MKKILLIILLLFPFSLFADYTITSKDEILINKVEQKIYKVIEISDNLTPEIVTNRIAEIIIEEKLTWRMKSIFEKLIENIENNYSINFEIKKTTWMESKYFAKQIDVFWVKIFATKKVGDNKIKHAATIMAEYLDSDENRVIDNPALIEKLKEQKAALIMFYDENDSENFFERESSDEFLEKYEVQDLYDVETRPNWFPHNKKSREFDASIEEIFHLISSKWYSLIDFSKYKLFLLQNSWTASASEIMIWTINDYYKNAKTIWTKTYWKWSVQVIKPYIDWSSLKYTVAKWFTWKTETWIDWIWIEPKLELDFDIKAYQKNWFDNQLDKAIFLNK